MVTRLTLRVLSSGGLSGPGACYLADVLNVDRGGTTAFTPGPPASASQGSES
jgi:hypothetical protein